MPLRLSTANQRRRADGPAAIGTCENSGIPPPPALARSPRIAPPPAHSLPPHAHAAARKCIAPCSLHFATSLLPASHATLRAHFEGESRRGHDPDKVGTGVSCPSRSLSGIDFVVREINKLRTEVRLQVIDSSSKICSLRHPPSGRRTE